MNEVSENKSKEAPSSVGVPVAIVIAGGLIAAAIYFGSSVTGTGTGTGAAPVADQAGNPVVAGEADAPVAQVVGDIRPIDDTDQVKGAANAKVTIIEYSDIECPFCKKFHSTMQQLIKEYPNDVRWVWRHFPLEQLHENARFAALATECAGEQGKFWEVLDYMMGEEGSAEELTEANLPAVVKKAGVTNIAQFTSCLTEKKYDEKVESDIADATVAGGRGTPYSVVIGPDGEKEALSGAQPYAAVKAMVDRQLKK